MWEKIKNAFHVFGVADLFFTYWPAASAGAMTWGFGIADGMPLSISFVLGVAVIALFVWVWDKARTPSAEKKEKRQAVRRLCALSHQITDGYTGGSAEFAGALNEAATIFAEDEDVMKYFSRLRESREYAQRDIPDLIEAMGKSCGMRVNREAIEHPFTTGSGQGGVVLQIAATPRGSGESAE